MMNTQKLNLAIFFGGKSAEHEVSIVSAKSILKALNKEKYIVHLIGISKSGQWKIFTIDEFLKITSIENDCPFGQDAYPYKENNIFYFASDNEKQIIDIVFPVLHGTYGEDGVIQGFLKFYGIPFVGSGVLGSSICMDKDVSKRLLKEANILTAKFLVYTQKERPQIDFSFIEKKLKLPIFIKPANLGSSIGINKVKDKDSFFQAIDLAFEYDNKIIIEEFIKGREIECSVLGNKDLFVSVLGEIKPNHEFYSYDAKYIDKNGATFEIPAQLRDDIVVKIHTIAKKAFKTLSCEGMGRVDFFVKENNEIYLNEINSIPGFTSISMYPKLLEKSGITYSDLIDRLIELALEKYKNDSILNTNFQDKL